LVAFLLLRLFCIIPGSLLLNNGVDYQHFKVFRNFMVEKVGMQGRTSLLVQMVFGLQHR
jgi:hypothetical protein